MSEYTRLFRLAQIRSDEVFRRLDIRLQVANRQSGFFLDSSSRAEWHKILRAVTADVYHLPEYVAACADEVGGRAVLFVAAEDNNLWLQPLIIRPIPENLSPAQRLFDAESPYGYSGPLSRVGHDSDPIGWSRRANELFRLCLFKQSIVSAFIRMNSFVCSLGDVSAESALHQRGFTVYINLQQSLEDMWLSTRHNHRRDINKGFKGRISSDLEELEIFERMYYATMKRVNASNKYFLSKEYFGRLASALSDRMFLCLVEKGDEIACVGLFSEMNGIVHYHLGATPDEFVDIRPSKLMIHVARSYAKEKGNFIFHLGGGRGAENDSLFHFKVGFSRSVIPFFTWHFIIDYEAYLGLVRAKEKYVYPTSSDTNNFFPEYRTRFDSGSKSGRVTK